MFRTAMLAAGLAFSGAMFLPGAVSAAPAGALPSMNEAFGAIAQKTQYWRDRDYYRERHWDRDDYRWRRQRYCERLRRACIYKEERGETGEGQLPQVPPRVRTIALRHSALERKCAGMTPHGEATSLSMSSRASAGRRATAKTFGQVPARDSGPRASCGSYPGARPFTACARALYVMRPFASSGRLARTPFLSFSTSAIAIPPIVALIDGDFPLIIQ